MRDDGEGDDDGAAAATNRAEDRATDGAVKWTNDRRPPMDNAPKHVVTSDAGTREVVYMLTPAPVMRVLEHAVTKTLDQVPDLDQILDADEAAKVRGNRQLSADVYATVVRTKQHRAQEKEAIRQADKTFRRANIRIHPSTTQAARRALRAPVAAVAQAAAPPAAACAAARAPAQEAMQYVTVKLLQDALVDFARATTPEALAAAITVRAQVSGGLYYAYFQKAFRQVRRDKTLRQKRYAEQVVRSLQELACPPEDPGQLWRKERVQLGPFSA